MLITVKLGFIPNIIRDKVLHQSSAVGFKFVKLRCKILVLRKDGDPFYSLMREGQYAKTLLWMVRVIMSDVTFVAVI